MNSKAENLLGHLPHQAAEHCAEREEVKSSQVSSHSRRSLLRLLGVRDSHRFGATMAIREVYTTLHDLYKHVLRGCDR